MKPNWLEQVWIEVADEIAYETAHPQDLRNPAYDTDPMGIFAGYGEYDEEALP